MHSVEDGCRVEGQCRQARCYKVYYVTYVTFLPYAMLSAEVHGEGCLQSQGCNYSALESWKGRF